MKESYACKPPEVEVWPHGSGTDLILRKNIQEVETPGEVFGEESGGKRWECDEVQLRADGILTAAEVKADFNSWWTRAASAWTGIARIREDKLRELSAACNASIIAGVDVQLADGKHHFSMGIEDQLNLMSLQAMVMGGQTEVAYHADGEPCRFFTAAEFTALATTATNWKLYHESYYNSMRAYVNALEDADTITGITYGDPVPEAYQTDVLKLLLRQMEAADETK